MREPTDARFSPTGCAITIQRPQTIHPQPHNLTQLAVRHENRHMPSSHKHTHTHTHTRSPPLTHTHTHTVSLSDTHTHTHTYIHTLSPSHTHIHSPVRGLTSCLPYASGDQFVFFTDTLSHTHTHLSFFF